MAIRIISDEPEIVLRQSEYQKFKKSWENFLEKSEEDMSLEEYVEAVKNIQEYISIGMRHGCNSRIGMDKAWNRLEELQWQ